MDGHSRVYVSAGVINFCVKSAEETEKKKEKRNTEYAYYTDVVNPVQKINKKINRNKEPGRKKKEDQKRKRKKLKSKARSENSEAKPFI